MIVYNLILFALAVFVLIISGSWVVKYLTKVAVFLRLSEYVLGFLLMAVATSIPELFVGISSGLARNTALSLGNVIGSNIANVTIIIGISILLAKGLDIKSRKTRVESIYMTVIVILPIALTFIGGHLSRLDGIILLGVFGYYTRVLWKQRKEFKKTAEGKVPRWQIVADVLMLIGSVIILFLSSQFVVKYASSLAVGFNLPPIIIGLFLVAIGTSLPELVFGTHAILKGHGQMALGNIIGSCIANATLVLGVTGVIYPVASNFLLFITSGVFMITVCFIFATFVGVGRKLYWMEGVSLILLYTFFIITQYYLRGIAF
ncbi:sodium:calcium antiporter [Candidatus Woesearchaeota archaeon]|nr:sodium:calcium antiporter [Candidatus Woesearchaeota archaeon]